MGDRHPVLLIPGLNDTARIFHTMSRQLQDRGWEAHIVEVFPSNGKLGIDRLAIQVANYVDRHFSPTQPLDLIGLSMGGIIGRYYVQKLGGIDRIKRYISLASPHQGTVVAYLSQKPAAIQMRPNSTLLTELNGDRRWLAALDVTSIWTPWDLMIVPAHSSRLPVGREEVFHVSFHGFVAGNDSVIQAVMNSLSRDLGSSDRNVVIS
jgi:triacylglycerol lipase